MKRDAAVRFWEKVDKSGECWTWTGSASRRQGYGRFKARSYVQVIAHRFSWELANGPVPDGLFVCHHCDNPKCVRPDHLFIGTHGDNMRDMAAKGRGKVSWRIGRVGAVARIPNTHCRNGHPYSETNTYKYLTKRFCRICHTERERRRRLVATSQAV